MKPRSSKFQVPSSKKAPNSKLQSVVYPELTSDPDRLADDGASERPPFDFEQRTAEFGERIVRFAKKIPRGPGNNRLIDQVVGAGTSIGANYCEANECISKRDFRCSIGRCKKGAKETKFFLRMIAASEPQLSDEARKLYREATELLRILAAMYNK